MKTEGSFQTSVRASQKASLVCLVASPLIMAIWELLEFSRASSTGSTVAQVAQFFVMAGIAATFHLIAFIVLVVPLFIYFYRDPESYLWFWRYGLPFGAVVGAVTVPFVVSILYQMPFAQEVGSTASAGCLYGLLTSASCLLNRPRSNNTAMDKPDPVCS